MVRRGLLSVAVAAGLTLVPGAAGAQAPRVQSAVEALRQDAAEYASAQGVSLDEAMRRLRAQEESVAATDRIRGAHRARLAGISIEHSPEYRIVVLLTGDEPVADQAVFAGGMNVPIVFRTGAGATHDALVGAIRTHQAAIASLFPRARGMGVDGRTGELVLMIEPADAAAHGGVGAMDDALEALTGVPVRVRVLGEAGAEPPTESDLSIEGGARVEGIDPANGRRYACTTGFVVTDGARTGVVTAAHCPDVLTYHGVDGSRTELGFVGQWGERYQDVQVHVGAVADGPFFYADTAKSALRRLTRWRNRESTRVGDALCRRGETTGYSCALVELTDYAPPGDLCAGPCEPVWVTVTGPQCRGGDSGGPIFSGTVAFGIVKGGNYSRGGTCNFYYYMSTDYLPPGWSLLYR